MLLTRESSDGGTAAAGKWYRRLRGHPPPDNMHAATVCSFSGMVFAHVASQSLTAAVYDTRGVKHILKMTQR